MALGGGAVSDERGTPVSGESGGRGWNCSEGSMERLSTFEVFPAGEKMLKSEHLCQFVLKYSLLPALWRGANLSR